MTNTMIATKKHVALPDEEDFEDRNLYEDDIATEEDLCDIACARAEYDRGETVAHEEIDWG